MKQIILKKVCKMIQLILFIKEYVDDGKYFLIDKPQQYGKTIIEATV